VLSSFVTFVRLPDELAEASDGYFRSRTLDCGCLSSTSATPSSPMFFELENLVVSQRHTTSSLLPDPHGPQHFRFVWTLYNARHSLLVFALVFGIAWLLAKRPILEMLAWSLHILIDIPTHQDFRPAASWPLSSYRISGLRWENHWFLAANYAALFVLYSSMWIGSRRRRLLMDSACNGISRQP
jgi:hypothetical protein